MPFFKPKSFLGIDIGAGGIKLVELRQEKNRPVLFTYGLTSERQDVHRLAVGGKEKNITELMKKESNTGEAEKNVKAVPDNMGDKQVEKYANTIKAVCRAAKTTSKSATVGLPVSSVFHAVVTLPMVKKEELDHILKAEIKKLLPMPLEEMALDYQVIKGDTVEKTQRILVNAVPHSLIDFYSKVFQRAGLVLDALEPESTALTRCLIGRDQAVSMLIDIGAERTNFFIIDQSVPVTHQTIESGGIKVDKILQNILGVDSESVEQVKYDLFDYLSLPKEGNVLSEQKFLDIFMPVVDPIMKEIDISFELYFRQTGNAGKHPEKVILTGGMGFMPYLAQYISEKFKIKSYVGDPWARVVYQEGLKSVLHQIGPRMSVAIGLALKNVI